MKLVDLSVPIEDGAGRLGLECQFETPYTFDSCGWQGSTFKMFCHYGSHVDAPVHFLKDGYGIDKAPLNKLLGPAGVIELSDHGEDAGITGDILEDRGKHLVPGDIAILRTCWSDKTWGTDAFWKQGPYLRQDAADWLVERDVKAVVYDFSEEYVVREPGFRGEDCHIHHTILGDDIFNIEYVHNLGAIEGERTAVIAMPLKLAGLDGSPSRVVALEGIDLPREFQLETG